MEEIDLLRESTPREGFFEVVNRSRSFWVVARKKKTLVVSPGQHTKFGARRSLHDVAGDRSPFRAE